MQRTALFVIVGPAGLALLALTIFGLGSGSGWSLLGIPLLAIAALVSLALPVLVPALFVFAAWAAIRRYYRKPAALPLAASAAPGNGEPPPSTQASNVAPLEELRGQLARQARRRTKIFVPVGLGAALLFYVSLFSQSNATSDSPVVAFVIFMVIGGGGAWLWAISGPGERYRKAFKETLIPRLLSPYGELLHSIGRKPDLSRAVATGFLPRYDDISVDDALTGRYRNRPIAISEILVSRKTRDDSHMLFQGLYVEIGVSTPFRGTTILHDREGRQHDRELQRLHLEDPVFDEIYSAWSSDQIEGRAVLTPAVMERLLGMSDGTSFLPPLFLISGDMMVFALPTMVPHALFEPPGLETHVAAQQLVSLEADFAHVFALADAMIDMHLSVRAPHQAQSSLQPTARP